MNQLQTYQHSAEVPTKLVENSAEVLCREDLTSDQEEDPERRELDDPSGDGHHSFSQAREEFKQRFPLNASFS